MNYSMNSWNFSMVKLKLCYFNGSITAFPIIETIANDITEYIATNNNEIWDNNNSSSIMNIDYPIIKNPKKITMNSKILWFI